MDTIGQRIKSRRKELHLTQPQIKEFTGISSGTLSDIENGKTLPAALSLVKLSKILDCTVDWILTGEVRQSEIISMSINEQKLIKSFRMLNQNDQDEILDIIELKLTRSVKREATSETMSNAKNA